MKRSELKRIITEAILEKLNEEEDARAYSLGMSQAANHKKLGRRLSKEELAKHSPSFIRGYKYTMGDSLYNRINSFATDFLSRLGSSRVKDLWFASLTRTTPEKISGVFIFSLDYYKRRCYIVSIIKVEINDDSSKKQLVLKKET